MPYSMVFIRKQYTFQILAIMATSYAITAILQALQIYMKFQQEPLDVREIISPICTVCLTDLTSKFQLTEDFI